MKIKRSFFYHKKSSFWHEKSLNLCFTINKKKPCFVSTAVRMLQFREQIFSRILRLSRDLCLEFALMYVHCASCIVHRAHLNKAPPLLTGSLKDEKDISNLNSKHFNNNAHMHKKQPKLIDRNLNGISV